MKFIDRAALQSYRGECKTRSAALERQILVCCGTGCMSGGSLDVYDRFRELLAEKNIHVAVNLEPEPHGDTIAMKKCGCHGFCEMGVLIRIEPQGYLYTKVKAADCEEIIDKTILRGEHIERLAYTLDGEVYKKQDEIPFYQRQTRNVLTHCGHIDATTIDDYLAVGGYEAFERALFEQTPEELTAEMSASNLRGRGGAGFPTGRKWAEVRRHRNNNLAAGKSAQTYVICNGDEGDPGAFMDRSIMEGDPHRMIEGMLIAALAVGSDTGYIYVRAEYPLAVSRLRGAIEDLERFGLLGDNILGTEFSFKLLISRGAGAFVCGEGSALINAVEGKRGMPKVSPPLYAERGLFGKPTALNNVETFANIPQIISFGAENFRKVGPESSPGTKAFALTGNIRNTGLIEVPMGTRLREIIFDIGGGVPNGKEFKAVQIGGPSGGCLTAEHLDLPLDFDSLRKAGAMIGSGGLVCMDSDTCMVEVARFFMHFTQSESCGKCVPCREGTRRMLDILENIVAGEGKDGDIELLLELADTITATALCGLGKTAPQPVISTIRYFRAEYEAHINEKRCPAGVCTKLRAIAIDPEKCKGCSKCSKVCPVGAISGKVKETFAIDPEKCIKCGACAETCPFGAIDS
ncbi:MAG: NADH-quinone oxidoreductase subunit NuoF [Oscillospiraceae bacterium]|jgi:NADH-quinone oxidoreductase subunit F|nr:NADH-quinone oxidoreductase subunit NuoF [Oscillospiraceae bacterium]